MTQGIRQTPGSGGGNPAFQTWTSLVNTTPSAMTVRATVEQSFDWVSPNRPDINLSGSDGASRALGGFAEILGQEDVSPTATTAKYQVHVSVIVPEDVEAGVAARIDRFSFGFDQCELKSQSPTEEPAEPLAETFFGVPVEITNESGPTQYFAYRLIGEGSDGRPQVSLYISDRQVG